MKKTFKNGLTFLLAAVVLLCSFPVFAEEMTVPEEEFLILEDTADQETESSAAEQIVSEAEELLIPEEEPEALILPSREEQETVEAAEAENYPYIKPITAKTYTGSAITPDPIVKVLTASGKEKKLVRDTDYTVAYSNNTNAGTATVTVTFIKNYTGKLTADFTIKPVIFNVNSTAEKHDFVKDITDKSYTGKAIRPDPIVKAYLGGKYVQLARGTDYTVAYKNNINAGTATATVKFRGNYKGSPNVVKTFTIKPVKLSSLTLPHTELPYTGSARTMTTSAVVKAKLGGTLTELTRGTDFSLSYKNNIEVGTATVTAKGKGNFTGSVKTTFEIVPAKISSAYDIYFTVTLVASGQTIRQNSFGYNGDLKTPKVVVMGTKSKKLKEGVDYTVSYSNNRNIGTGKAIIKGIGNYTGSTTKKFTIHMIDYVQWAKYVADDNENYRDYGHQLPSKDGDGAFSCSSLVGAALYLNGYIAKLPPDGHGWLGGLVKKETCLEGQMMLNGFKYYSRADLGAPSIMAQDCLSVLKPGDIMWRFHGGYGMHVGIYMGNGLFIESRGGTNDPNAIGVFPDFNYFEGVFRLDGKYLR